MCMFLPMEVITVTKPVDTVAISSLTDIPSEIQPSLVCIKHKRSFLLQKCHNYTQIKKKKKISEEKAWLKESEKKTSGGLGINIENIHQYYFQSHVWSGNIVVHLSGI